MSEWSLYSLEQCTDILDSMRVPVNEEKRSMNPGSNPYYGANGIQGYINGWLFDEPLILVAEDGGYFDEFSTRPVAYKIYGKSWVNNHAHILRPKTNFSFDYIFYALEHKNIMPFIKGGTRAKLNQKELREIEINVPNNKDVQEKIGSILSATDRTIEKTEALIEKYQHIKAGLMHDLFTRGITADGKLRPPREQAPELYQETPVGWVPREWLIGDIKTYAEIYNNLRFPLSAEVRENMKGKHPYYGPTGVVDHINEYRLNGKFVLIGEDGDHFLKYDRMEMTQLVDGKFNVNNHAHILSGKSDCSTNWIFVYFLHRDITFWLTRQGAGRYKLNKATLEKLLFPLPSPREQVEIVGEIFHIRETVSKHKIYLEKLRKLKSGLMHDLLSGKVEVKAADV